MWAQLRPRTPASTYASGFLSCLMVSASLPVPAPHSKQCHVLHTLGCFPLCPLSSVSWPQGMWAGLSLRYLLSPEPAVSRGPCLHVTTPESPPHLRRAHPCPEHPALWEGVSAQDCEACGSEALSPDRQEARQASVVDQLSIVYMWKEIGGPPILQMPSDPDVMKLYVA